jgi:hypothetical protein
MSESSWPVSGYSLFPPMTADANYACSTASTDGYSTEQYDDMLAPTDNYPLQSTFTYCSACGHSQAKQYTLPSSAPMGMALSLPTSTPEMVAMRNWILDRDLQMM